MNLDYKILWFENDKDAFDARKEIIQDIVKELGFNFVEPRHEIDSSNLESIKLEDYDLMLVDFSLENNEKGTSVVEKIRNKEILTDVVFYSSDGIPRIREELHNLDIEGCYCSERDIQLFETKVGKVIESTLKKVQDVNNMRGLIMAETSDLDELMVEIIECVLQSEDSEKIANLTQIIFDTVGQSVKERYNKHDEFKRKNKLNKLMENTAMFENSVKIAAIQAILGGDPNDENSFTNLYGKDISKNRNVFAHVSVAEGEDGTKKLISKGAEIEFTSEFCKEVRENLKRHRIDLENLKKQTCKKNNDD